MIHPIIRIYTRLERIHAQWPGNQSVTSNIWLQTFPPAFLQCYLMLYQILFLFNIPCTYTIKRTQHPIFCPIYTPTTRQLKNLQEYSLLLIKAPSLIYKSVLGISKRPLFLIYRVGSDPNKTKATFLQCIRTKIKLSLSQQDSRSLFFYKRWHIFPGPCRTKEGSPAQGLNLPVSSFPEEGQGKPLGSRCWQTKGILRRQEPAAQAQLHPETGCNPLEGADLAAELHSSDVPGGLPPHFTQLSIACVDICIAGQQMSVWGIVFDSQRAMLC